MSVTNSMNKARQCFEARGISARTGGDTCRAGLLPPSDGRQEDGNRQHTACVAELFAPKRTDLPGANNRRPRCGNNPGEHRCGSRWDAGTANQRTYALNRRNSGITEEAGGSSRMAYSTSDSEWTVNLQVTNPVQGQAKAEARSSQPTGRGLRLVFLLTEYW